MRFFIVDLRRESTDATNGEKSPPTVEVPKFMGTPFTARRAVRQDDLVK
jgi:hypothetical protein